MFVIYLLCLLCISLQYTSAITFKAHDGKGLNSKHNTIDSTTIAEPNVNVKKPPTVNKLKPDGPDLVTYELNADGDIINSKPIYSFDVTGSSVIKILEIYSFDVSEYIKYLIELFCNYIVVECCITSGIEEYFYNTSYTILHIYTHTISLYIYIHIHILSLYIGGCITQVVL